MEHGSGAPMGKSFAAPAVATSNRNPNRRNRVNATIANNVVRVTLSRRNLTTLLNLLDRNVGMSSLRRACESNISLIVVVEEDAEHYGLREPGVAVDAKGNVSYGIGIDWAADQSGLGD